MFGCAQAGVVHQPEQRAIARRLDHTEEALDFLGLQVARLLFAAALSLWLRGFKGAGGEDSLGMLGLGIGEYSHSVQ